MHKENVKSSLLISWAIKARSSSLFWILTFVVFTAMAAQVAVHVNPVPFTLQTIIVLLAGGFLGSKNGAYSMITYLAIGIAGVPVFANFGFGPAAIFGPTGGYLLAFPMAAFLVGYIIETKNNFFAVFTAMLFGNIFIILSGALYLSLFFNGDINYALYSGAAIFSIWGLIKVAASIGIYSSLAKKYPRLP